MKANQAKMGQWKRIFIPRWIENPKGRFRQKWDWKMKEWNNEKHWPQMRTSNVYPALTRLATATCIQELSNAISSTSFIALSHGFAMSLNDGLSKRGFPLWICCSTSHYVPNLPMFRLPLWNFSVKLPINHAFQAFIHA